MYKKHYLIFFLSSLSNIYCMNWDNLWVIAANTLAHALGDPRNNTSNHSPRKPSFSAMTASENTIQSCQIIMPDPFMTQKNCSIQWGFFVPDSESSSINIKEYLISWPSEQFALIFYKITKNHHHYIQLITSPDFYLKKIDTDEDPLKNNDLPYAAEINKFLKDNEIAKCAATFIGKNLDIEACKKAQKYFENTYSSKFYFKEVNNIVNPTIQLSFKLYKDPSIPAYIEIIS